MTDLSFEMQVAIGIGVVGLVAVGLFFRFLYKRVPRKLNKEKYQAKWSDLQKMLKKQDTWPEAIVAADLLLDKALRQRRYKGKKMGERIVAAQRKLSDNDGVWFAHNLAKDVIEDPESKLTEKEVKKALVGFRQALRDLGALSNDQKK